MTPTQNRTVELAFGRILRMGSRPTQPGDGAEFERCRDLIMSVLRDGEDPVIEFAQELRGRPVESLLRPKLPGAEYRKTYNPKYLAYCAAHGNTPEQMMAHDRARFPGGHMAGYIAWVSEQNAAKA